MTRPHLVTIPRMTRRTAAPATDGACRAAAALGVSLAGLRTTVTPPSVGINLAPGHITLISGHSGSGKSAMLADITRTLRQRHWHIVTPPRRLPHDVPVIDLFGAAPHNAMRALARAGLGDARCFVRSPSELSDGEGARLRLALAMHRARRHLDRARHAAILLDEFASGLDAITARAVAALVRRFADATDAVFILATARDDLRADLRADDHIHLGPAPATPASTPLREEIAIRPAGRSDYTALAHHHYRPGHPATISRVIGAWHAPTGTRAGVLTISRPTRNGTWRHLAWPGRYDTGNRRTDLRRLNDEVRTISRVIIDPRFRNLGIARRLVEHYLHDPITPRTEAVAAMGRACPFFRHAGMSPVARPPALRDARLLDALHHLGIHPWQLVDHAAVARALREPACRPLLERELRRWADDSGTTRALADASPALILAAAAPDIAATPTAYVHQLQDPAP